jgi:tRNA-splicing ligase RtcB
MFQLSGKYANATVFAELVEEEAQTQIIHLLNHPMFEGAQIAIMPDVHAGAGCVIGLTAIIRQKMVIPNIIGVDIGCGVASVCVSPLITNLPWLDAVVHRLCRLGSLFITHLLPSMTQICTKTSSTLPN